MANFPPNIQKMPHYRADIDGLRALAVASVVAFHAFPKHLAGGFVGVDIFFVISGYLITSIVLRDIKNDAFTIVNFYIRRIIRIFPALFTVLVGCFAFGWLALFAQELKMLGKHIFGGAFFISNIFFWMEAGYFDTQSFEKPLLHLWSLGIEEQFYILFPVLLLLTHTKKLSPFITISLFFLVSFSINIFLHRNYQVADFFLPFSRFWEIAVGSLLALLSEGSREDTTSRQLFLRSIISHKHFLSILSLIGLTLILIAIATNTSGERYPGIKGLVPTLGAALIILSGKNSLINERLLSKKALVFIGLISYPLYLWHWPIISFLHIVYSGMPPAIVLVCAVLASFLLAWLTYRFIEQPIRFKSLNKARVSLVLLCLVFSIGLTGGIVGIGDGFPKRKNIIAHTDLEKLKPGPLSDEAGYAYTKIPRGEVDHCRFFDANSSKTIAIIGDSHAWTAFYGVAQVNKKLGMNTLLLSGNGMPLMVGAAEHYSRSSQTKHYREYVSYSLDVLLERKDIVGVFFIARGPAYLEKILQFDYFQLSLQATADLLTKSGKRVFLVADNPEFLLPPRLALSRPFRSWTRTKAVRSEEERERQADYLSLLRSVRGATVINALDQYCPDEYCLQYHNGEVLNFDADHLSIFGSKFLAEEILAPYLEQLARSD